MFNSPASTTLSELVNLRKLSEAVLRTRLRKSASVRSGAAASKRLGRGLDFAEVREYIAGDDVRNIDWNVTARTGKAHTKLFVEERESPVMLVVDFRASMRFGTRGMYKSMMAARLAAILGWCYVANGDRVGGMVFTDEWRKEIRPESGRRGLMKFFQAIENGQRQVPKPGKGQFATSLSRLRALIHAGTTVIILSDFDDFDRRGRSALTSMLSRHDFKAVHIVDPLEETLPSRGQFTFVGMFDEVARHVSLTLGGKRQLDDYLAQHKAHVEAIDKFFGSHRNQLIRVRTSDSLMSVARTIYLGDTTQDSQNDSAVSIEASP